MGACCCCQRKRYKVADVRAVVAEAELRTPVSVAPLGAEDLVDELSFPLLLPSPSRLSRRAFRRHRRHKSRSLTPLSNGHSPTHQSPIASSSPSTHSSTTRLSREMGNESSRGSGGGGGGGGSGGARAAMERLGVKKGPSVKELVERAQKTGVLKASKASLKEFPGQLAGLSGVLRSLDLSENRIPSLPSFVGDFGLLRQLHLDANRLTALPDELGRLKKLETLTLERNELTSLPDTLVGCLALKTVKAGRNRLTEFPLLLCRLPALEMADVSGNRLTALPQEVASCRAMELNLNGNQMAELNAAYLAKAPRLKVLRLEENCLPLTELSPTLLEGSIVAVLDVQGNLFQDRELREAPGYDAFETRRAEAKKKMY